MPVKRDRISLHFVLVAPFVLQTFVAVGIVGYLSYKNGEKAVNDLADQVIVKTEQVVDQHLDNYLETPWQALNLTLEEIKAKRLNIYDLEQSGRHYWRQAKIFKQLSFNGHFLANGEGAGAGQWVPGVGLLRTEQSERTQGRIHDYLTNQSGDRTQRLLVSDYNALEDDWYKALQKARKPIWARSYAATPNFEFDVNVRDEVKQRGEKAVECYAGQLNQVFMNLLVNAIDALEEAVQKNPAFIPQIHITTEQIENWVRITIANNGIAIPESIQAKMFDPFFTTRPVGKGTGLGLSVSYQIITERHNGKLYFEPGSGAKFAIELPIYQS